LIFSDATAANMADDGEMAEPGDCERGELFNTDTTPITLVIPSVAEGFDDGLSAGQACHARGNSWIAEQHLRPDLLRMRA
jgi:hypothetical protein